jgi:hypothetical protein
MHEKGKIPLGNERGEREAGNARLHYQRGNQDDLRSNLSAAMRARHSQDEKRLLAFSVEIGPVIFEECYLSN